MHGVGLKSNYCLARRLKRKTSSATLVATVGALKLKAAVRGERKAAVAAELAKAEQQREADQRFEAERLLAERLEAVAAERRRVEEAERREAESLKTLEAERRRADEAQRREADLRGKAEKLEKARTPQRWAPYCAFSLYRNARALSQVCLFF